MVVVGVGSGDVIAPPWPGPARPCRPRCTMRRSSRAARRDSRTAWPPIVRRCRLTDAGRRSRRRCVGAFAGAAVVLVEVVVGAFLPTIRTSSSDNACACAERSDATAVSACAVGGGGVAAAASVASWLSARARSSCAASSSTSGGGGDAAHAVAVPPSNARAAAPNNICRLLTVSGGRGTCNILPLLAHRAFAGRRCAFAACHGGPGVSLIVGSKLRRAESCPDNSR